MAEITREELIALTESNSKIAVALDRIASRLEDVTTKQEKILDKLSNGMSQTIINGVTTNYNNAHKDTIASLDRIEKYNQGLDSFLDHKLDNSSIAKDIDRVKWFIGVVSLVIIVATVVLRGIDNRVIRTGEEKKLMQYLEEINKTK